MTTQKTRRKKGRAQFGYTRQLPSGRWQASYVDKAGLIPELRGSEQRRQPFLLLQLPTLAVFGDVLSHVYRTNRTKAFGGQ